jgi:hypothetical protein
MGAIAAEIAGVDALEAKCCDLIAALRRLREERRNPDQAS